MQHSTVLIYKCYSTGKSKWWMPKKLVFHCETNLPQFKQSHLPISSKCPRIIFFTCWIMDSVNFTRASTWETGYAIFWHVSIHRSQAGRTIIMKEKKAPEKDWKLDPFCLGTAERTKLERYPFSSTGPVQWSRCSPLLNYFSCSHNRHIWP